MNSPDISVIIPVHNREKYISRAIRSILNQSISHEKYEIIHETMRQLAEQKLAEEENST